jgi:hypothetical protein
MQSVNREIQQGHRLNPNTKQRNLKLNSTCPSRLNTLQQQGCLQNLRVVESSGAIEDSIATTAPEPNVFAEDAHNASELLHDSYELRVDSIALADQEPNAFAEAARHAPEPRQDGSDIKMHLWIALHQPIRGPMPLP